jgi:A/G-specific adenine glycosylase
MPNGKLRSNEELCVSALPGDVLPSHRRVAYIRRRLLAWFLENGRRYQWRRPSASKYQRVIAEVLLQRTKADVVARMFSDFAARYPSWSALAKASEQELEDQLRPLGLWKRRARSMKALAIVLAGARGRYPKDRSSVAELPGVGQYICNAILMFDQGLCAPLLDVNLARVLERLFGPRKLADIRYDPFLQRISSRIVEHTSPALINWAFLDHAALICTIQRPKCTVCPLNRSCCYYASIKHLAAKA